MMLTDVFVPVVYPVWSHKSLPMCFNWYVGSPRTVKAFRVIVKDHCWDISFGNVPHSIKIKKKKKGRGVFRHIMFFNDLLIGFKKLLQYYNI